MTSDGIASADWDRVHELALKVVNAVPDELLSNHYRVELCELLDALTAKYGERPSLLATRADYVLDAGESEQLLRKAYDLATRIKDNRNAVMIALSLVDLFVEDVKSYADAHRWLALAEDLLQFGTPHDAAEFKKAAEAVRRLENA